LIFLFLTHLSYSLLFPLSYFILIILGLEIQCPILVLSSQNSAITTKHSPEMMKTDSLVPVSEVNNHITVILQVPIKFFKSVKIS
jgi:hypothetical protein